MQSNFQGSADYLTVKREGMAGGTGPPIARARATGGIAQCRASQPRAFQRSDTASPGRSEQLGGMGGPIGAPHDYRPGRRRCQSVMLCQARAAASTVFSSQARPMNCRLMGRPSRAEAVGDADGGQAGHVADGAHRVAGRTVQDAELAIEGRRRRGPARRHQRVEARRARDRPRARRRRAGGAP